MIFKTLITIASFVVVAAIIGISITVYLNASRTTVKVGYWNNDNTFVYSKLIETFDKISTGQMIYKNITYSISSSSLLTSFESYDDSIYVTDASGSIIGFDTNWKGKSDYVVSSPLFIKQINNEFYTGEGSTVNRRSTADLSYNSSQSLSTIGYTYRAIYYDQSNYYVVLATNVGVVLRNLQLNLVATIPIPGGEPYSIDGYDGKYYVGVKSSTSNTTSPSTQRSAVRSSIVTLKENRVLNTFQMTDRCTNSTIIQLLFDTQGFLAVTCAEEKTIYIYHHSGAYTGRSLTFPTTPKYINYDSNGNFVVLEEQRIRVYS